jgi:prepilin-type N-terminal cleavage/methylation domain-containing protein
MLATLRRIRERRASGEIDGGFTLIELLIVIVVLGILAAVVVLSLGGVTGNAAKSACQSDVATINTAAAAYNANKGAYPAGTATWWKGTGTTYLQSWPKNSHYKLSITKTTPFAITVTSGTVVGTFGGTNGNNASTACAGVS